MFRQKGHQVDPVFRIPGNTVDFEGQRSLETLQWYAAAANALLLLSNEKE
jgi:hypothetical protein